MNYYLNIFIISNFITKINKMNLGLTIHDGSVFILLQYVPTILPTVTVIFLLFFIRFKISMAEVISL